MKTIHTDQAPAAVGPYSQAIEANGVLYCSGQIAINPAEGKIVATTIEEQAEQCCRNVEAVLKEAGTDMRHVIKTTCFLAEIADFKAFNEASAASPTQQQPAAPSLAESSGAVTTDHRQPRSAI